MIGLSAIPGGRGIALPPPETQAGAVALERALQARRSIRDFAPHRLTPAVLGQFLWAAQGINDPQGLRTTPSAGALYPLVLYAVLGPGDGIGAGIYRYDVSGHALLGVADGDRRPQLAEAALRQVWMSAASAIVVLAAVYERTTAKYRERGRRYVHVEAGHAAQNLYLQCVPLGLAACEVGAFDDGAVARVVGLPVDERPVTLVAIGQPAN